MNVKQHQFVVGFSINIFFSTSQNHVHARATDSRNFVLSSFLQNLTALSLNDSMKGIHVLFSAARINQTTNIPLVAGLISLLVVVGAVTAGIAFYLYRQKTKSSLTSGTSPSTDPNIYSESPTVTESNGITRDDPPLSYGEVEYEQAATVTPPVIPPRARRP